MNSMKDYKKILNIWAEKSEEYIWLHNQSMRYLKNIQNMYTLSIITLSLMSTFTSILNKEESVHVVMGMGNLLSSMLFLTYMLMNFNGRYIEHYISRRRFLRLLTNIQYETNGWHCNTNKIDFITLRQFEFKNIAEQSPHISDFVLSKFRSTFKHILNRKPYFFSQNTYSFHTKWFVNRDPKYYRKNICEIMFLSKFFNRWKYKNRSNSSNLGPFYDERKYIHYNVHNKIKMFEFQNIKLENNNLEIEIP